MKKGVTKMGNRINACFLALVMIVGLVAVPAGEVKAAENPYGSIARTNSDNGVVITFKNEDLSEGWSGFDITLYNGTNATICDWIIELKVPQGTADTFKCWESTLVVDGDTIYLYPKSDGSNAVIGSGESAAPGPGGGFQGKYVNVGSQIQVKVYYNIGTESKFDYSSGVTNDDNQGGGSSGGGQVQDTITDKNLNIEYNYAKLLQESLYFYDANMCGPNVGETSAFTWRDDCHTMDMTANYNGQTVDVSGGFHDAGDHVKFGLPQGYSAAVLGLGYYQFKDAYDELGQTEHFKTILDYFCDYFVNCAIYTDNANKSGTVKAFCYQVGDGTDNVDWSDHAYWGPPEEQEKGGKDYNRANKTLFTSDSMPATDIVSISASALALHAYNFPESSKSNRYLQTAKDLFTYAKGYVDADKQDVYKVKQYESKSWADDYCSAAAALYLATGDGQYKDVYDKYKNQMSTGWVLCWDNTSGIAAALMKDWGSVYSIAGYGNDKTVQGFKFIMEWGSARYNTTSQFLGLLYDNANGKFTMNNGSFCKWATGQMEYLLGNNNDKRCFVVGYNANSSQYPHHRAASRSSDAGEVNPNHYTLLGALVGGPIDQNDTYRDNQTEYVCNEVAIDYNAGLVGAAAGLYLLHKNDADAKNGLATDEELSAIGIKDTYFGAGGGGSGSGGSGSGGSGTGGNGSGGNGGSGNGGTTPTGTTKIQATSLTLTASVKGANNIPVGSTIRLAPKKKATLKVAAFLPEGAEKETVTFTSNKPSVAKVDSKGKITAGKKAGKAIITVKTASGKVSKTITVKVMKKAVSKVKIKASKTTIKVKKTVKLKATLTPNKKNASNNVFWKSSKPKVATVSSKGVVKGLKKGKTKITAVATDGSGKKATVTIQVK